MSSSFVWVRLYYKGEDEPERQPIKIKPIPEDVADLKEAVLPELGPALLGEVHVYSPGTEPPFSQANSMRVGKKLSELIEKLKNTTPPTSDDHPLIVVAPDPKKQQVLQDNDNAALIIGVKRQLLEIAHQIPRPTPIETPASIGSKSLQDLREHNLISRLPGIPGQPAVLDAEQLRQLSALTNEHQVVAFMTQFLENSLGEDSNIQVVNSEEYPWLVTTSESSRFNQKPDNIFCHSAVYSGRNPFATQDQGVLKHRRRTDQFGVITTWGLRDCIDAIGEAKVKIANDGFGEVVNYARHICYREDAPLRTKMILYDKVEFWLIQVVKGEISRVQICHWDVAGSQQILRDFLRVGRSPWIVLLKAACEHWGLVVARNAFLGMGTYGRVFKVRKTEGGRTFMALKLVLPGASGAGALELQKEKTSLNAAARVAEDTVVSVEHFHDFGDQGAAMVIREVGTEVPRGAWRSLFETLGHLHEKNIVHGDPRLSNAIYMSRSVRWIDFRTSAVSLDQTSVLVKRRDMELLAGSCCDKAGLPVSVCSDRLGEYDGTVASAVLIFEALQQGFDAIH